MPLIDIHVASRRPFADGVSFGPAGTYDRLDGEMTFAVDPTNPANAGIVDLAAAPRDAEQRVRFRSDFSLLLPTDAEGRRRLLVELPNRGRRLWGRFNGASPDVALSLQDDPGDGFLFRHGWSVLSIGWQWDVYRGTPLLGHEAPPVLENGMPVQGQNLVEIRPEAPQRTALLANRAHRPYPAARLDDPAASLFVRDWEDDADVVVPRSDWRFARETAEGQVVPSDEHVYLASGFQPGKIYNLVYTARGARVVGTGLLAFRDAASFLRQPGPRNPAPAGFERVYGFGISQTGRMIRHFLSLGLNVDEVGDAAFDGLLPHVAGSRRGEFNHRFAQPSAQSPPGFGHRWPFADREQRDPFGSGADGLLQRQHARGRLPKVIATNSAAEYWRGDGSLQHIDGIALRDLEPDATTRIYHLAGTQHIAGELPPADPLPGMSTRARHALNVVDYTPLLRAALTNLDRWVSDGIEPPASLVPRLDDGTAVTRAEVLDTFRAFPQATVPDAEKLWVVRAVDLGERAEAGVGRYPVVEGATYPCFAAAVDTDGNERAGVRLPDIAVPVGTHTGWNLRHPELGAPDQQLPMLGSTWFFARTKSERVACHDPRPSLEERYTGRDQYAALVREHIATLVSAGYLLAEDVELVVGAALDRYDLATRGAATEDGSAGSATPTQA